MNDRVEIPMELQEYPSPIRLPFQDGEKIILFISILMIGIGTAAQMLIGDAFTGLIFQSLGAAGIIYVLLMQIPFFMSISRNKKLIAPIKSSLKEEGYSLSSGKILRMWSEGSVKAHRKTFVAGAKQGKLFRLYVS